MTPNAKKWLKCAAIVIPIIVVVPLGALFAMGLFLTALGGRVHFTNDTDTAVTYRLFAYNDYEGDEGKVLGPFTLASGESQALWKPWTQCVYFPEMGASFSLPASASKKEGMFGSEDSVYVMSDVLSAPPCWLTPTSWVPGDKLLCERGGRDAGSCVEKPKK